MNNTLIEFKDELKDGIKVKTLTNEKNKTYEEYIYRTIEEIKEKQTIIGGDKMNRSDFEILNKNIIYFDNGATTLKPKILVESLKDYYNNYSANAHRGDYDISLKVDTMYENTRKKIKNFINAKRESEIIFTSGTTDSLNKIIFHISSFFRVFLTKTLYHNT